MAHNHKNLLFIRKKQAGFSLIEMLIAMAVFMILVTILAGIYVAFSRNQTRAKISQSMLNDLQYNFELMSRQIRDSSIVDFSDVCPIVGYTENCIILEREDGSLFTFAHNSDALDYALVERGDDNTYSIIDAPGSFTELVSPQINNMNVSLARFYIQPSTNPYLPDGQNQQPKVTIVLRANYVGSINLNVGYHLQTTVSSRIYKR